MGAIIGFKDIIPGCTVSLSATDDVTATVASGSVAGNVRYRSLKRSLDIEWENVGAMPGIVIVRCQGADEAPLISLACLNGLRNVHTAAGISQIECAWFLAGDPVGSIVMNAPQPALLDDTRSVHNIPFCLAPDLTASADRFDFLFTVAAESSGTFSIGRILATRGIYLPNGIGKEWEIPNNSTSQVSYVGRTGSPSVLRGTGYRDIVFPIPLLKESQLFGDGTFDDGNANFDDLVRYCGIEEDVIVVPRTGDSDLFKQRATIVGLMQSPLPGPKHRAGRLWNEQMIVRENR